MEVLDFERQGSIGGWRQIRKAVQGIKDGNPNRFFFMFRMNGMPRAQGCAGAACVSFAHCFGFSMAAKVVQCLISGHAVMFRMNGTLR